MSHSDSSSSRTKLPRGVCALHRPRGGRGFRATIRQGKRGEVHLGIYETPWLAAFAHGVAAQALGRGHRTPEIPTESQPSAERVREVTANVRKRLGLDPEGAVPRVRLREVPPETEDLLTFFEVAVVGFWRSQAGGDTGDHPGAGVDAAAGRLVEAARLLFWSPSAGHPEPLDALTRLLARRLDQTFRRADVTRDVLDDDGDDPGRVARWLAFPDAPGGRLRGFRQEVRYLYADLFEASAGDEDGQRPRWASVLGVEPPFTPDRIRAAYRARSRDTHPDAGGSAAEFVRVSEAYEEARAYCSWETE